MMTKGGKEEEKVMGPLFPRLHVNDTNKGGGPRAPPRNKMALYEQFSIPSQRFNSAAGAVASRPLHHGIAGNSVPSTSSSQGGGQDRTLFPSFYVPSNEPVGSSEQINTHSHNGQTIAPMRMELERRSIKHVTKETTLVRPVTECSSRRKEGTGSKNFVGKKAGDEDDFMVPTDLCTGVSPCSNKDQAKVQEKQTFFRPTSPQNGCPTISKFSTKSFDDINRKRFEGMGVLDARTRNSHLAGKQHTETMRKVDAGEKHGAVPVSEGNMVNQLHAANTSSQRDSKRARNACDKLQNGGSTKQIDTVDSHSAKISLSRTYVGAVNSDKPATLPDQGYRESNCNEKRVPVFEDGDEQRDDLSDCSVESSPGLDLSPDDVVGAIGPKHFWKARRAILNQQRVFAVQVFELHRLIKVQKLIAASPDLLIQADPCLKKSVAPTKAQLPEKTQQPASRTQEDAEKTQSHRLEVQQIEPSSPEFPEENQVANQPLLPRGGDEPAPIANAAPNSTPTAMSDKQPPWCLHPPPSQWLVPVLSPSEGLIYKPYTGHCPPAGSILAPSFCSPVSVPLPSSAGDFMSSAFGVPHSLTHQPHPMAVPPIPPSYFPPFGIPVMNPVLSTSAVDQASNLAASQPSGHVEPPHFRSSCNMSHLQSEAFSGGAWRFHHASRDNELQGSSASSPFEKAQGEGGKLGMDPLPLFPMASAVDAIPQPPSSGSRDVIKVVPHNAKLVPESAARIFKSIQMERRRNDS